MTSASIPPTDSEPPTRWMLWIDGCGGFLIVVGASVRIGGGQQRGAADVCVQADLPRIAGEVSRDGSEYFWLAKSQTGSVDKPIRSWVESGNQIPIAGSAKLRLTKPSPLSASARLDILPPHRFGEHVDAIVLADQTLLIGPTADCHIRCRGLDQSWVVVRRDGQWTARSTQLATASPSKTDWTVVGENEATTLGQISLTLETA